MQSAQGNRAPTGNEIYNAVVSGDIIKVCLVDGAYELQGSSSGCSNNFNNNQGPNGGEFYQDRFVNTGGGFLRPHEETTLGGLALIHGSNEIVSSSFDPVNGNANVGSGGIIFFNNCRQIIADLPVIPSDPKGGDDIDGRYRSDHSYDSVRYGIMSRPRAFSPFDDGHGVPQKRWQPSDSVFGY